MSNQHNFQKPLTLKTLNDSVILKDLPLCNSLQQTSATEDYPEESNN